MKKQISIPKPRFSTKRLIEMFNKRFPVGSRVRWRSVGNDSAEYQLVIVRSPAYDMHGQPVVFFEERSGCCSIMEQFVDYADGIK